MKLRLSPPGNRRGGATPKTMLARVGRCVLWLTVAVIGVRGVSTTLAGGTPTRAATLRAQPAAAAWPDDTARAFASDYARAFLTASPDGQEQQRAALERFTSPELAGGMLAQVERAQAVDAVQITRTRVLDRDRALVTVAARVTTKHDVQQLYLAVPIGRDALDRLAVTDLPSLDSPPRRGASPAPPDTLHATPTEVQDVLGRFMRSYLAGDTAGLTFLTPPGVHIDAIATPHDLAGQVTARTLSQHGRTITVLADISARDRATRARYELRYRVELVRRDRWLVQALNPSKETK